MPGPPPKSPATRRRRNRSSTARTLTATPSAEAFALPVKDGGWHDLTLAWWADTWASPMAEEYVAADAHGLIILAELVDRFWRSPSKDLAAEIRLQRAEFGLSPIARRRLQWEVARVEDVTAKRAPARRRKDPRRALEVVA
jgi:hypothetical protein